MTTTKEKVCDVLKTLLFSKTLWQKRKSHKIAYIAVTTALAVAVNALEIKLGVAQFSFTIFFSVFSGVLLGGGAGFCAGFLGDLIGFFIHPMGEYSPWIGISTGLMAFFAGVCVYTLFAEKKEWLQIKLAITCVLIFIVCTCGITALYLNLVWFKSMTYFEYLSLRLFGQGQIFNSLFNSILAVLCIPRLVEIKALGIKM